MSMSVSSPAVQSVAVSQSSSPVHGRGREASINQWAANGTAVGGRRSLAVAHLAGLRRPDCVAVARRAFLDESSSALSARYYYHHKSSPVENTQFFCSIIIQSRVLYAVVQVSVCESVICLSDKHVHARVILP